MTKKLEIENDNLEQDSPKPSSTKKPDTPSPEQSHPMEELNKLPPGQFIPAELIMKILRHNATTSLVRLQKINFDSEQDPETCNYSNSSIPQKPTHPTDTHDTPSTPTNSQNKKQKKHDANQQPQKPVITVTEAQNQFSTNPPPSYMERDTNRPPSKKDLKILATYLAKKKNKKS